VAPQTNGEAEEDAPFAIPEPDHDSVGGNGDGARGPDSASTLITVPAGDSNSTLISAPTGRPTESPPVVRYGGEPGEVRDGRAGRADDISGEGRRPVSGKRIGQYRMVRFLGKGAAGSVYEAVDTLTDDTVAIKLLSPAAATDARTRSRFLAEARLAGRVSHPHLVAVRGAGQADNRVFLVMELVRGGSCADRLRADGPMPEPLATKLVRQAAAALSAVHAAGILHRDIKPANLMLDADGNAKLTDFGLAKGLAASDVSLTRPGELMGTPNYMSPEQCRGEQPDARSDLYSLGATYYCLLTGRPPFSAGNRGQAESHAVVMAKHLREPVPDPRSLRPELPEAVSRIIRRSMAKDPAARYRSAEEMIADLDRVASPPAAGYLLPAHAVAGDGEGPSAGKPSGRRSRGGFIPGGSRAAVVVAVGLVAAIVTAAVSAAVMMLLSSRGRTPSPPPATGSLSASVEEQRTPPVGPAAAETPATPALTVTPVLIAASGEPAPETETASVTATSAPPVAPFAAAARPEETAGEPEAAPAGDDPPASDRFRGGPVIDLMETGRAAPLRPGRAWRRDAGRLRLEATGVEADAVIRVDPSAEAGDFRLAGEVCWTRVDDAEGADMQFYYRLRDRTGFCACLAPSHAGLSVWEPGRHRTFASAGRAVRAGRWCRVVLECVGDRHRLWIDGEPVCDSVRKGPAEGALMLRATGGTVLLRNLVLTLPREQ
jgi:hypothetical protein